MDSPVVVTTPEILRDFTNFVNEFKAGRHWGEIRVVFMKGVPMSISKTINTNIYGPEQAEAASKGRKPHDKEYR